MHVLRTVPSIKVIHKKQDVPLEKTYLYTTMSMTKMIRSKDVLQSNG